jgi:glutamyl-tRNA reductase
MRKQPNETLADWAERVRQYELEFAIKELKKGTPIDLVMEAMSAKIQQKMLHPILVELRATSKLDYNLESSKKAYEEAFKKNKK